MRTNAGLGTRALLRVKGGEPGSKSEESIKDVTAHDWGGHMACAEISAYCLKRASRYYGCLVESGFRSLLSELFDLESLDPEESDVLAL